MTLDAIIDDETPSRLVDAMLAWIDGSGEPVEDPEALFARDVEAASRGCEMTGFLSPFRIRDRHIEALGYCVPTAAFAEALRPAGPILEIGAGRGYLSRVLRLAGIDAVATDAHPRDEALPSCPVEGLTAMEAIRSHRGRTVLCSWPTYEGSWLAEAALAMESGRRLLVVGEDEGGCTADDRFFDLIGMDLLPDPEIRTEGSVWSFPGIHDHLQAFRRA